MTEAEEKAWEGVLSWVNSQDPVVLFRGIIKSMEDTVEKAAIELVLKGEVAFLDGKMLEDWHYNEEI